jgi:site-specific recombinase XerD
MTSLAPILEALFTERLARQRHASPRTISAYRDTLRLLLGFVQHRTGKVNAREILRMNARLNELMVVHGPVAGTDRT